MNAADATWHSIENPRDGTILSLMREWAVEINMLSGKFSDFRRLFLKSLHQAHISLRETTEKLDVLKKANVVDAGAHGFVTFLNGIANMLNTGRVPEVQVDDIVFSDEDDSHKPAAASEDIPYRYCTEALVTHNGYNEDKIRESLSDMGVGLIVSRGRSMTKIHIHTNNPAALFFRLREFGSITEQSIDDMILQYNAVHNPVSSVAVVTDSIADIPRQILDRYQIHVISQKIIWGDDEYLDRVTISGETFYPYLDQRESYPSSSAPEPARVAQVFAWLASHYKSIVAIPVSKGMSVTWQVMNTEAEKLKQKGYPVTVIDSRLNSAAQGLLVIGTARDAAEGMTSEEIIERAEKRIKRTSIFVSVATFKYMVRGGRVSKLKGLIGTLTNLKPIVSIDSEGKGYAFGASFSQDGSRRKIIKHIKKRKEDIENYAVVHGAAADRAMKFAEELKSVTGKEPEYIMEISPIVGIHAGIGAVAVACTYNGDD
jgi:hypothetical protein